MATDDECPTPMAVNFAALLPSMPLRLGRRTEYLQLPGGCRPVRGPVHPRAEAPFQRQHHTGEEGRVWAGCG